MAGNKRTVAVLAVATTCAAIAVVAALVIRHNQPSGLISRSGSVTGAADGHGAPGARPAPLPPTTTDPPPSAPADTPADPPADETLAHPAAQADPSSLANRGSAGARNLVRAGRAAAAGVESKSAKAPVAPAAPPAAEPLVPAPQARMALSFVGADPIAENIWVAAINDPSLPPNTRKDLIEDLNEDGFPDPKHITEDDLPLILNRLELITALAPESMDDVNAAAFEEAYKDLVNMVYKLMGE